MSIEEEICVVTVLFLIVLFVTAFIKPPLPEKQFQVELTPHGENSSEVYLEVWNTGDTVRISAQIGVLSRSDGRSVKKYAYDAFWPGPIYAKGHWRTSGPKQDHGKRTSAGIEKGRKDRIRIARMEPNRGDGISEMTLIGIDESLMWDFEPSANSQLPFFTLTVNLFAEGFDNTVSKEYRIGPKACIGPVEMVEVTR